MAWAAQVGYTGVGGHVLFQSRPSSGKLFRLLSGPTVRLQPRRPAQEKLRGDCGGGCGKDCGDYGTGFFACMSSSSDELIGPIVAGDELVWLPIYQGGSPDDEEEVAVYGSGFTRE